MGTKSIVKVNLQVRKPKKKGKLDRYILTLWARDHNGTLEVIPTPSGCHPRYLALEVKELLDLGLKYRVAQDFEAKLHADYAKHMQRKSELKNLITNIEEEPPLGSRWFMEDPERFFIVKKIDGIWISLKAGFKNKKGWKQRISIPVYTLYATWNKVITPEATPEATPELPSVFVTGLTTEPAPAPEKVPKVGSRWYLIDKSRVYVVTGIEGDKVKLRAEFTRWVNFGEKKIRPRIQTSIDMFMWRQIIDPEATPEPAPEPADELPSPLPTKPQEPRIVPKEGETWISSDPRGCHIVKIIEVETEGRNQILHHFVMPDGKTTGTSKGVMNEGDFVGYRKIFKG